MADVLYFRGSEPAADRLGNRHRNQATRHVRVHGVSISANGPSQASGAHALAQRAAGAQPVGATATDIARGIKLGGSVLAMKACTALCMKSHRSTP